MKAACRYTPSVVHRSVHRFLQIFVLILLVGMLAACPAGPPPAAPPPTAEPPAEPTATAVAEPTPTPEIAGVDCAKSPPLATSLFGSDGPTQGEDGYYNYMEEVDFQRPDETPRSVRIRVHPSLVDDKVMPVAICPLLAPTEGYCSDHFDLEGGDIDQLRELVGTHVFELFRFEMVDFAKWDGVDPNESMESEVPADALVNQFEADMLEIWVEFRDADLEAVAMEGGEFSPAGAEYPGVGFWSCVEGEFAWTDFKAVTVIEEGDKHYLKISVSGWNDPALGMQP